MSERRAVSLILSPVPSGTQLTEVRKSQTVDIAVDMFRPRGARPLDSIAPASGQEFALLPPDSATANFIKMVQRIAAKIVRTITTG